MENVVPRLRRRPFATGTPTRNGSTLWRVTAEQLIVSPHASPVADKVFRIDPDTHRYIGYKEFTPGSVVSAPEFFMERRFEDVLPAPVADLTARAIHAAQHHSLAQDYSCAVFEKWWECHVVLQKDVYLNVSAVRRRRR